MFTHTDSTKFLDWMHVYNWLKKKNSCKQVLDHWQALYYDEWRQLIYLRETANEVGKLKLTERPSPIYTWY